MAKSTKKLSFWSFIKMVIDMIIELIDIFVKNKFYGVRKVFLQ